MRNANQSYGRELAKMASGATGRQARLLSSSVSTHAMQLLILQPRAM